MPIRSGKASNAASARAQGATGERTGQGLCWPLGRQRSAAWRSHIRWITSVVGSCRGMATFSKLKLEQKDQALVDGTRL